MSDAIMEGHRRFVARMRAILNELGEQRHQAIQGAGESSFLALAIGEDMRITSCALEEYELALGRLEILQEDKFHSVTHRHAQLRKQEWATE